jgi:hypothetical protein
VDLAVDEGILAHVTREREGRRVELEGRKARLEGKQNALQAEPDAADVFRRAIGLTFLGTLLKGRKEEAGSSSDSPTAPQSGTPTPGGSDASLAPPAMATRDRILAHQAAMRAKLSQSQQTGRHHQHPPSAGSSFLAAGVFGSPSPPTAAAAVRESPPPPAYSATLPLHMSDLHLHDPAAPAIHVIPPPPAILAGPSGALPPAIPPKPERRPSPEAQRFMDMGFPQEGVEFVLAREQGGDDQHHLLLDHMFTYAELRRTFPHALVAQALEPPCTFATAAEATPFLTDLQRLLEFGFAPGAVKRALLQGKTFDAALEALMAGGGEAGA